MTKNHLEKQAELISRFKSLYRNTANIHIEGLSEIYTENIVFVDPVHKIQGLDELGSYISSTYKNVISCEFTYLDEVIADNTAMIKWDMILCHKRLNKGAPIQVRGMSLVKSENNQISYHEDIYDLGALLYENVPVLKLPVRWLKNRLSA